MMYPLGYNFIGLSTEEKPEASSVLDGATYYEVNTGKLWVAYKGTWYDQDFE